ncbi:MAG: hypothetical protein PWQ58_275 [Archaeoglobaceae archaeon]|nr:hypothetical protein [Archaeoglobaceae archaeon]
MNYLDKFVNNKIIKSQEDLIEIIENSTSRKNIILALRNLINYCEQFEIISQEKALRLKKILKCVRSSTDAYVPSDEEVKRALEKIDRDGYRIVFKLIAFSGLRVLEAIKMLSEFRKGRLMINGNIAKYPLFDDRSTKRAYFAYMPKNFAMELKRIKLTKNGVCNYFYRKKFNPKYLRKWNYNFLILNGVP